MTVPPHARARFQSASGSLAVTGTDMVVTANSDSGSIRVEGVTGVFNLFSRTGVIEAKSVRPTGESGFASESGAVSISLSRAPSTDLFLFCKSGAVLLDYGASPIRGSFHLEARSPEGEIQASVPFDRRETVDRNGTKFTAGVIRRGDDKPLVRILTSTGRVTLRAE